MHSLEYLSLRRSLFGFLSFDVEFMMDVFLDAVYKNGLRCNSGVLTKYVLVLVANDNNRAELHKSVKIEDGLLARKMLYRCTKSE